MTHIYLLAAGLLVATTGLRSTLPSGSPRPVPVQAEAAAESLLVTVSSNKSTYKKGETAKFTIRVKNAGKNDVTLHFSSGQSFDLQAFKPGETDASWTWSMDKLFTMMLRDQNLKAGEELVYSGNWPNLPAGEYNVVGILTVNKGIKAAPISITVK